MDRNILLVVLFGLFLVQSFSQAPGDCPGTSTTIKAFIAGYVDADSLTVPEILAAGKLATKYSGFEVESFMMSNDGNCIGGGGLYTEFHCRENLFPADAKAFLKRVGPGYRLFFHHIHIRNKSGQRYCLPGFMTRVRKA